MAIFGLPGGAELWIILGIVLLLFGPTQLPKLAKTFGKSARVLKDSMEGRIEEDEAEEVAEAAKRAESTDDDSSA
ncbi:MAG TPA: twin-arginine translocase TatA/TatE family subunit [Coriobacteriia bacterium]|nr:twin-arginine translocase TatA/TatE family subunit [Coriobacteriia bacterium]